MINRIYKIGTNNTLGNLVNYSDHPHFRHLCSFDLLFSYRSFIWWVYYLLNIICMCYHYRFLSYHPSFYLLTTNSIDACSLSLIDTIYLRDHLSIIMP